MKSKKENFKLFFQSQNNACMLSSTPSASTVHMRDSSNSNSVAFSDSLLNNNF
jgi:hypothetical protein